MAQIPLTPDRLRTAVTPDGHPPDIARRLAASASSTRPASPAHGPASGSKVAPGSFRAWFEEQERAYKYVTTRVDFASLGGWGFDPDTGNLGHVSGKFFTVEGMRVYRDDGPVTSWTQPIIVQPEIGVLGILMKEFDGVLYCLMQAKMEPGNVGPLQLSPTVQATRSNYTGVHRGRPVPYLEYFVEPGRGVALADVLQSEQGTWFLRKRNRNVVVLTQEDVPLHDGFRWLTLGQLNRLLHVPNLVNMDARTVLASLPIVTDDELPVRPHRGGVFEEALRRSMAPANGALHSMPEVLSWLTAARARRELRQLRIPLAETAADGWRITPDAIRREDGRYFSVVAVDVRAGNREVAAWGQPLLAPSATGFAGLLTARFGGVLHALFQARAESGTLNVAELAPTVMYHPEEPDGELPPHRMPFLDLLVSAPRERRRFDVLLSEEGGRFDQAVTRYVVVDVDREAVPALPPDYCWLAVHQAAQLLRHSANVNVQARTLLACLATLW